MFALNINGYSQKKVGLKQKVVIKITQMLSFTKGDACLFSTKSHSNHAIYTFKIKCQKYNFTFSVPAYHLDDAYKAKQYKILILGLSKKL